MPPHVRKHARRIFFTISTACSSGLVVCITASQHGFVRRAVADLVWQAESLILPVSDFADVNSLP